MHIAGYIHVEKGFIVGVHASKHAVIVRRKHSDHSTVCLLTPYMLGIPLY